jgi:hypothetical protein
MESEDILALEIPRAPEAPRVAMETIDLDSLKIPQNYAENAATTKVLATIPIRKPSRQEFIRVHPVWRLDTLVLEMKDEGETYLLAPSLRKELESEIVPKALFTTINRDGVLAIWPVRLPGDDGKLDPWNTSAHQAAALAVDKWVRVKSNRSLGAYEIAEPVASLSDPQWPDLTLEDIIHTAFKGLFITSLDHPAIKKLRGEQ